MIEDQVFGCRVAASFKRASLSGLAANLPAEPPVLLPSARPFAWVDRTKFCPWPLRGQLGRAGEETQHSATGSGLTAPSGAPFTLQEITVGTSCTRRLSAGQAVSPLPAEEQLIT